MFPDHLNHRSRFYGHSGSHPLTMYEEESTCLSWFIGSIKFSKELSTLQTSLFITRSRLFANLHWTMKEQSKTAVCSWQGMAPVAISRRTCRANRYLKMGGILLVNVSKGVEILCGSCPSVDYYENLIPSLNHYFQSRGRRHFFLSLIRHPYTVTRSYEFPVILTMHKYLVYSSSSKPGSGV